MERAKDYYKILGINKNATKDQIKEAYRRLAKKYHPDINKSHDAVEKFREINEAYSFLIQAHHEPPSEDEIKGCHYHIGPHKGELKKCRFCGKLFCTRHSIPHPPKLGVGHGIPDEVHPCPDCPPCPYCENKLNHPTPYEDPYFNQYNKTFDFPYQCHRCKKWVTIDTRHHWQHDCTSEETIRPEPPRPKGPKPPETPKEEHPKFFVSQVFDTPFDVQLNENIRSSLRSLRKEILHKKCIKEHEIREILNNLIIILKNNSFEKKLDTACYKFVKNIYEKCAIDTFSHWNEIYNKAKKAGIKPQKIKSPRIKPIYYTFGLAFLVLICLLFYFASATTISQDIKNVSNTKTISSYENVSNKISFSTYLNDIYASDKQEVTLNGFLERSIEGDSNSGVHVFSVVDDFNNKVILEWTYNDLKKYLPDIGKTKEVYSVQGVFKREYKTIKLKVENLNLYKREPAKQVEVNNVVRYTEQITVNRTSSKYPLIRNLVFKLIGKEILCEDGTKIDSCSNEKPLYCSINGLKDEPTKCGCPSGKRLYQNQCINEVKCSDGTYEPECSKNKPKQCVNSKLVDNPEVCGCPENYKVKDKKCVYIRCSDGTIEPDCSTKLHMQCIEGNFIYNPNKCGCPDGYVKRENNCVKSCSDGTAYDECSKNKPLYCADGDLVHLSSKCGCPLLDRRAGEDCYNPSAPEREADCKQAFEYLNNVRYQYNRKKIEWDSRAYNLAVFRSRDMYERNYFDHVTPEGKCDKDFQSDYGFKSYEVIAENAGGMTYYSTGEVSGDCKESVDGWLTSRGHRYNLLYDEHISGAIGCYKHICVFLGVHNNPYGLGAGPCHTGEEGLAYWQSVGKQEGEV